MTSEKNRSRVTTTKMSFKIIEFLWQQDEAQIEEVATEFGKAKSTIHRHLATLEDIEYVVNKKGTYRLSHRFLEIGEYTRNNKKIYQLANEKIGELAEQTGERVAFVVEEHGYGIFLYIKNGDQGIRTDRGIGKRMYLHATASGKAILANLPSSRVEEIIGSRGLPQATPNTITQQEELYTQLNEIREQGYSLNDQENVSGLRAVAAPVMDVNQSPIGAILISGPIRRLQDRYYEEDLPNLLMEAANELELEQAYESDMESVERNNP